MQDWARPVVHWEIEATDPERQRAFYADLLIWQIGEGFIMEIPAGIGGPEPGPAGHIRGSERSGVTLYVQVADLRASIDKSVSLGATVVAEPFDVPGGPTLAGITDPEGNPVMLVQPESVAIVEITTFPLAGGHGETFLALDRRLQTELVPNRPGFLRRTTARHGDHWPVVTLWRQTPLPPPSRGRPRAIRSRANSR